MFNFNRLRWLTVRKRPQRLMRSSEESHELLTDDDPDHPTWYLPQLPKRDGFTIPAWKLPIRMMCWGLLLGLIAGVILMVRHKRTGPPRPPRPPHPWDSFRKLDGYDKGIRHLVRKEDFIPETGNVQYGETTANAIEDTNFRLRPYQPHIHGPLSLQDKDVPPVQQCFLDADNTVPAPSVYAFDGVAQNGVEPLFGSYDLLKLRNDVCFDRYGRYGPYGLGYATDGGGSGLGLHGDQSRTDPIWATSGQIDWRSIDLGDVQRRCYQRNRDRYPDVANSVNHSYVGSLAEFPDVEYKPPMVKDGDVSKVPRTVLVLRAWGMLEYTPAVRLYIRSLVNELSLHSGGQYDVHLLVEVKNVHKPIWTSKQAHDHVLAETVPEEFRSMATLWSQALMQLIYPGPFQPQFKDHGSMYPAMRSMHFALQWFMLQHPEYEYFWNWEVDLRYVGHYYELLDRASMWAKEQPRDHLWERDGRFYIPSLYQDWNAFMRDTGERTRESVDKSGPGSGQGEEADFISFEPIFNPQDTLWNRRMDVTGWDTSKPIPQRRASIVIAARLSRRLLLIMHNETYVQRHGMASEMFPASMCLHHGLKAVFAPHPVYTERDWPAQFAEEIFNGGEGGQSGGYADSVFGEGPKNNEHALVGTTFYYNARFAGRLWRRWMGYKDGNRGGPGQELAQGEQSNGGRMCLRSMLLHPVKRDVGEVN